MLSCSRCEEFISEYSDHRLSDTDARQMLSHCSDCEGCRSFLSSLLELGLERGRKVVQVVPASLDLWVRSSIAGERKEREHSLFSSLSRKRIAVPVPIAAVLLILIMATAVYSLVSTKGDTAARPTKRQIVTQVMSLPTITIENK